MPLNSTRLPSISAILGDTLGPMTPERLKEASSKALCPIYSFGSFHTLFCKQRYCLVSYEVPLVVSRLEKGEHVDSSKLYRLISLFLDWCNVDHSLYMSPFLLNTAMNDPNIIKTNTGMGMGI